LSRSGTSTDPASAVAVLDSKGHARSEEPVSEALARGTEEGGAELATKGGGQVLELLTVVSVPFQQQTLAVL
jgi:hypothetical protein